MNRVLKLNIGCGLTAPEGWVNSDSSLNACLSKYPRVKRLLGMFKVLPKRTLEIPWPDNITILNVTKGLPYPDGSVMCVYSSHLLEHLWRPEAAELLKECHRVLIPGGVIRIIVPDFRVAVFKYMESLHKGEDCSDNPPAAEIFLQSLDLYRTEEKNRNVFLKLYRVFNDKNSHKWAFDACSLRYLLETVGFRDIVERTYGESLIENVKELDSLRRFEGSICLEAVK